MAWALLCFAHLCALFRVLLCLAITSSVELMLAVSLQSPTHAKTSPRPEKSEVSTRHVVTPLRQHASHWYKLYHPDSYDLLYPSRPRAVRFLVVCQVPCQMRLPFFSTIQQTLWVAFGPPYGPPLRLLLTMRSITLTTFCRLRERAYVPGLRPICRRISLPSVRRVMTGRPMYTDAGKRKHAQFVLRQIKKR